MLQLVQCVELDEGIRMHSKHAQQLLVCLLVGELRRALLVRGAAPDRQRIACSGTLVALCGKLLSTLGCTFIVRRLPRSSEVTEALLLFEASRFLGIRCRGGAYGGERVRCRCRCRRCRRYSARLSLCRLL